MVTKNERQEGEELMSARGCAVCDAKVDELLAQVMLRQSEVEDLNAAMAQLQEQFILSVSTWGRVDSPKNPSRQMGGLLRWEIGCDQTTFIRGTGGHGSHQGTLPMRLQKELFAAAIHE